MATLGRKLRMGMVGGGPGAFIGDVHHKAAVMDGGFFAFGHPNLFLPADKFGCLPLSVKS